MANRLATSTSPYLRQHADNPVDWYEWSPEALGKAKREGKPILLSVGYSSCHWCHVMAHESFEDPDTAAVLNELFVNVKVDREERPDVDAIYQRVVQLMGQGGGWPLTVFLTPDAEPFYGGTYFPKEPRYGRPGFVQLCRMLHEAFTQRPKEIAEQAEQFLRGFAALSSIVDEAAEEAAGDPAPWEWASLPVAARRLLRRADDEWGGIGREPKFPNPTALEVFARVARDPSPEGIAADARAFLALTLRKMAAGGIYDHLRGGFARYGTDRRWLVPHFEKMLYDNAQLLPLYAEAAIAWPDERTFKDVVAETIAYLKADMRTDAGTFYAATDADSEGEEGKYFCWTPSQIAEVLGDDARARRFCAVYDVTDAGNFEHGWSILNLPRSIAEHAVELGVAPEVLRAELDQARAQLLAHRYGRVPPHRDDKVLTSWTALLVSGLCRAAHAAATWGDAALADEATALALAAGRRLVQAHVVDGRVMRAEFQGVVHTRGYLDDVAFLARACLDLHERTLEPQWRTEASTLAAYAIEHHVRPDHDGFFFTADDAEELIERTESQHDGPIPSGVGVIVEVLARLDAADDAPEGARGIVDQVLQRFFGAMGEPFGFASLLTAARHVDETARHVKIGGPAPDDPRVRALADVTHAVRLTIPHAVTLSFHPASDVRAVVCAGQACTAPLTDVAQVRQALSLNGREPPR